MNIISRFWKWLFSVEDIEVAPPWPQVRRKVRKRPRTFRRFK